MTYLVLPAGVNWAESVSEMLEWKTAVLTSERGQEQRRQQRVLPRLSMEWTTQNIEANRVRLDYFLASQGRRPFYACRYWDRMRTTNTIGAATTFFIVPSTRCRSLVNGMPVVLCDGRDWSVTEVAFLAGWGASSVTLSRPNARQWGAPVDVYPAFLAVLDEQEASMDRRGFRAAESRLRVRSLAPFDPASLFWPMPGSDAPGGFGFDFGNDFGGGGSPGQVVGTFGNFFNENFGGAVSAPPLAEGLSMGGWNPWINFFGATHYDQPVLTRTPDYRQKTSYKTLRKMNVLDSGTGLWNETDVGGVTWWTDQYTYFAHRAPEMYGLLSALAYMRGQAKAFWCPTFMSDLTLRQDAASGATSLLVDSYGRNALGAVFSGYNQIMIRCYDGRVLTRNIGSGGAGPIPSQEYVTLDTPLPFALPMSLVRDISFMRYSRATQDLFEVEHLAPVDEGVATCSVTVQSLGTTYSTPWQNSPAPQPVFG